MQNFVEGEKVEDAGPLKPLSLHHFSLLFATVICWINQTYKVLPLSKLKLCKCPNNCVPWKQKLFDLINTRLHTIV